MNWVCKSFGELTNDELFDLFYLRIKVFVVEQEAAYQEVDYKDKLSHHIFAYEQGVLVATARIIPKGISYSEVSIGRVVVDQKYRKQAVGDSLLAYCMNFIEKTLGESKVRISAQKHLQAFYQKHGFQTTKKEYLEDGIPHIEMYASV